MNPLIAQGHGTALDYAIIVLYFVGVLAFGTFFGRYSHSTRDFFFSGQRFSWWLIAMSMVATGVGSYSFIKYSAVGFTHGMSSSMTYMNDWFFQPFFMFGWLPIIYFSRVKSIPEYFQRRFDGRSRFMAVVILMMYMIGYIGFNLYTLGVAAEKVLGVNLYQAMCVIAVVSAIYIAFGGQTAVIFTDLLQGFMLLLAGFVLFFLGLDYLAMDGALMDGVRVFWSNLGLEARLPFAHFNSPPDFNFVGVFWQDGVASSITFLFINQGLIMRFLAAKSMTEGRKTILYNTLFMLPLSMIVVGNAGWIGHAMMNLELIDPGTDPKEVFVKVAELVCHPGVFGFVLAALTAALMSTIDTLTNAVAAVFVYDVYQPYIRPVADDRHYLRTARIVSLCTSGVGLSVAFIFTNFESIYAAHGAFVSAVTPPIVVSVFLGAFWKRYTPAAAFWSMFGGAALIFISVWFPKIIYPFATWLHGVDPSGNYKFMRAFFGLVASGVVGVVISLFTRPKPEAEIEGLWIGTVNLGRQRFKNGEPNFDVGRKIVTDVLISDDGTVGMEPPLEQPPETGEPETAALTYATRLKPPERPYHYPVVRLSAAGMEKMKVREGDLLYVGDARRWLGGLRSLHARAGSAHDREGVLLLTKDAFDHGNLVFRRPVRVEKIF